MIRDRKNVDLHLHGVVTADPPDVADGDMWIREDLVPPELRGLVNESVTTFAGAGSEGADGAVWYTGATDPGAGLGVDGDFYLQSGTGTTGILGDVWKKAAGAWAINTNIRGATGATGATGAGVPVGGALGQVLSKASATDYDTAWADDAGDLPVVGANKAVLDTDYEVPTDYNAVLAGPVSTNATITVPVGSTLVTI